MGRKKKSQTVDAKPSTNGHDTMRFKAWFSTYKEVAPSLKQYNKGRFAGLKADIREAIANFKRDDDVYCFGPGKSKALAPREIQAIKQALMSWFSKEKMGLCVRYSSVGNYFAVLKRATVKGLVKRNARKTA